MTLVSLSGKRKRIVGTVAGQLALEPADGPIDLAPYREYTGRKRSQETNMTELEQVARRYQRRRRAVDQSYAELVPLILRARHQDKLPLRRIAAITGLSFARIHQIEKETAEA